MMHEPGCDRFTPIRMKEGVGFCQKWQKHVNLDPNDSRCLCDYCFLDSEGNRHIDPDVYFVDGTTIGLRSEKKKRLDMMIAEAETMTNHVILKDIYNSDKEKNGSEKPKQEIKKKKKQPTPSLFDFK